MNALKVDKNHTTLLNHFIPFEHKPSRPPWHIWCFLWEWNIRIYWCQFKIWAK